MRYRLTCLTPLLVGDGRKLSPIDYMVWKDHVNVLDQWRIFRLLAKGPRLEGYLSQLKKADKLDFASWGGFAQNFAGRRIPFECPAYSAYWNRAVGESLHIPTFAAGASGPYLPGTAIKGALRTGMVFANWRDGMLQDVRKRVEGERFPRRPAESVEEQSLGTAGTSKMRFVSAGDSGVAAISDFKVYLLRTSTLAPRGANYRARLEAEPARRGGRQPSRGEHTSLRGNGLAGNDLHRRLGRKAVLPAARGAAQRALARRVRPRQDLRSCEHLCGRADPVAAAVRLHGGPWAARPEPGTTRAAPGAGPGAGHLPAVARLGRRTAGQERMARHHQSRLPADPAGLPDLQPGAGDEPAVPQDAPDRVPEQQDRQRCPGGRNCPSKSRATRRLRCAAVDRTRPAGRSVQPDTRVPPHLRAATPAAGI